MIPSWSKTWKQLCTDPSHTSEFHSKRIQKWVKLSPWNEMTLLETFPTKDAPVLSVTFSPFVVTHRPLHRIKRKRERKYSFSIWGMFYENRWIFIRLCFWPFRRAYTPAKLKRGLSDFWLTSSLPQTCCLNRVNYFVHSGEISDTGWTPMTIHLYNTIKHKCCYLETVRL